MAAATVTTRRKNSVLGDLVYISADSIAFASNGDTWDTGLNRISAIMLTPTADDSFGFSVSGGTITLAAGAGITFRGGVLGSF